MLFQIRCKCSLVDLFGIDLQYDSRVIATRFALCLSIGNKALIGRLAATKQLTCGICDRYLVKITSFVALKRYLRCLRRVSSMQIFELFSGS